MTPDIDKMARTYFDKEPFPQFGTYDDALVWSSSFARAVAEKVLRGAAKDVGDMYTLPPGAFDDMHARWNALQDAKSLLNAQADALAAEPGRNKESKA